MGLFDKIQQSAKNRNRSSFADEPEKNQESEEFLAIKSEIEIINHELEDAYNRIGRKLVAHVIKNKNAIGIDVSDILYIIEPKLNKKQDLEDQFINLEKENVKKDLTHEKELAEEEYYIAKSKLDRELELAILSKEEYDEKLALAQKRIDNFEIIHCIEKEAMLGFITDEEKNAKIALLT